MIRLRAHHISNIAHSLNTNFSDFNELFKAYNKYFAKHLRKIHELVITDQTLLIQVVRGMDDICINLNPLCPNKEKFCFETNHPRDIFCEVAFPLMAGRIYSAAEILEIIKDFKRRTGFNTPEEW